MTYLSMHNDRKWQIALFFLALLCFFRELCCLSFVNCAFFQWIIHGIKFKSWGQIIWTEFVRNILNTHKWCLIPSTKCDCPFEDTLPRLLLLIFRFLFVMLTVWRIRMIIIILPWKWTKDNDSIVTSNNILFICFRFN